MTVLNNIARCLLCLTFVKSLVSAKIYVIDLANADEDTKLWANYDDYDPIDEFDYDEYSEKNRRLHPYNVVDDEYIEQVLKAVSDKKTERNLCQRVFRSMRDNKIHQKLCMQRIQSKRSDSHNLFANPKRIKKLIPIYNVYSSIVRKQNIPVWDNSKFSQDYVDVNDLGRTDISGFSTDYVDVGDFSRRESEPIIMPDCPSLLDEFGEMTKSNCVPTNRNSRSK